MELEIGKRTVLAGFDFICPSDESVRFSVDVGGSQLQFEAKFELEEKDGSRIKSEIDGVVVKLIFINWHQPLGVMTPYAYNVATFNKKNISVAAHGSFNTSNHHIFLQIMGEEVS